METDAAEIRRYLENKIPFFMTTKQFLKRELASLEHIL